MNYQEALKQAKGKAAATGEIIVQAGATPVTFTDVMWHDMGPENGALMIGTGDTNFHVALGYPAKFLIEPHSATYPDDFPDPFLVWEYYDRKGKVYTAQKGEITASFSNEFKKIDGKFSFATGDGTRVYGEFHLKRD
ncbi:hypothetical protein GIW70_20730 [Pseudomonas syringae]|nr:hypothetical protein [Pseudomonas syringae]MCF5070612.1 hypothetical protein [Pseudomonas syringae]